MAESSEGANNSHEQEMDAGMEQHSAGLAAGPCDPGEALLLADVAEGADPPAHVTRLLRWIRQDAGHAAGLGATEDADEDGLDDADMDALLGLVYVLVLETGFTPLGEDFRPGPRGALDAGNLRRVARMPRGWRSREAAAGPRYVLDLALGPGDAAAARLVGVVCSGTLIVNMIAADAGFSVVLEPSRFVRRGAPRNLRALSLAVKDAVSGRARAAVMNGRGVSNPSLLGLPAELLAMLAAMLPVHDLFHLGASCSALQHLLDDQGLWRLQLRRHHPALFGQLEASEAEAVDWKKEFRAKRAEEQAAAAARLKEMRRNTARRCARWMDSF